MATLAFAAVGSAIGSSLLPGGINLFGTSYTDIYVNSNV